MRIGTLEVGPGHPCAVVCELSGNHQGLKQNALALIDAAKDAGASAVKFQCWSLEEIAALRDGQAQAPAPWSHLTHRQIWEQARTPFEWFPELAAHCRAIGIPWFSTVMGYDSLALLQRLDCPAYKLAKAEGHVDWLRLAATSTRKPVLVSVPDRQCYNGVYHLICPEGYPVPSRGVLAFLDPMTLGPFGLSLHSTDLRIAPLAVARGAHLIEVHLMLPGTHPLDESFSYTPDQCAALVRSVRESEEMLG